RDRNVTGVQTCALPISPPPSPTLKDQVPRPSLKCRRWAGSVVEDEGHFEHDVELRDLPVDELHLLLLHPRSGNVPERSRGAFDPGSDRVIETLIRAARDGRDSGNGYSHGSSLNVFRLTLIGRGAPGDSDVGE